MVVMVGGRGLGLAVMMVMGTTRGAASIAPLNFSRPRWGIHRCGRGGGGSHPRARCPPPRTHRQSASAAATKGVNQGWGGGAVVAEGSPRAGTRLSSVGTAPCHPPRLLGGPHARSRAPVWATRARQPNAASASGGGDGAGKVPSSDAAGGVVVSRRSATTATCLPPSGQAYLGTKSSKPIATDRPGEGGSGEDGDWEWERRDRKARPRCGRPAQRRHALGCRLELGPEASAAASGWQPAGVPPASALAGPTTAPATRRQDPRAPNRRLDSQPGEVGARGIPRQSSPLPPWAGRHSAQGRGGRSGAIGGEGGRGEGESHLSPLPPPPNLLCSLPTGLGGGASGGITAAAHLGLHRRRRLVGKLPAVALSGPCPPSPAPGWDWEHDRPLLPLPCFPSFSRAVPVPATPVRVRTVPCAAGAEVAAPCRAAGVVWKTPSFFCRGRKAPSPRTALSRACPVRAPPLTARPTVLLLRPAVLWSGSLFLCCVGGGGVGVRVWRGGSRRRPMDGQHPIPLPSGTGVGAARREGDRAGVRGTPACLGTEPGPAESRTRPQSPSGVSRRTLQCLSRRRRRLSPREDFVTCTVQYIRL